MIDLGSSEFGFEIRRLDHAQLERYSLELFDYWDSQIQSNLSLDDYSVSLEIEEGSIKGRGRIMTAAVTFYAAVAGYGAFIQGLQTIKQQILTANDALTSRAESQLGESITRKHIRSKSGAIGKLERLFYKVQHRELTPEEAIEQASALIGTDSEELSALITRSIRATPIDGEQTTFLIESDMADVEDIDDLGNESSPTPNPDGAPPKRSKTPRQLLCINITRDSKQGEKKTNITKRRK